MAGSSRCGPPLQMAPDTVAEAISGPAGEVHVPYDRKVGTPTGGGFLPVEIAAPRFPDTELRGRQIRLKTASHCRPSCRPLHRPPLPPHHKARCGRRIFASILGNIHQVEAATRMGKAAQHPMDAPANFFETPTTPGGTSAGREVPSGSRITSGSDGNQ
ncbi:unnamed protein product [Lampetra planeri]